MTNPQTLSWILFATAMASQSGPADLASISRTADAINHAVPTEKEMKDSLTWLTTHGLAQEVDGRYSLTQRGTKAYLNSSKKTSSWLKIWSNLEKELKKAATE